MLNLSDLYSITSSHSTATGEQFESYIDNIYIAYEGTIDPALIADRLVDVKNGHFTLTAQGVATLSVPIPNWDGFNAYMLTDATFKGCRDAVRVIDGDLNSALFDTYGLVATNGVGAFSLVWGQWVTVSGISAVDRETIAVVAEGFNLPGDFVGVIRG